MGTTPEEESSLKDSPVIKFSPACELRAPKTAWILRMPRANIPFSQCPKFTASYHYRSVLVSKVERRHANLDSDSDSDSWNVRWHSVRLWTVHS